MNSKTFSESFSRGVSNCLSEQCKSYLILLENLLDLTSKTGHESPDSDPRLQFQLCLQQWFRRLGVRNGHQNGHQFPCSVSILRNRP